MAKKTKTPKLKTRIAILLDSSSSMMGIAPEAIAMFNEQVAAIKKGAGEVDTKVSLAVFATSTQTVFFNEDVKKLKELTSETYRPNGGTAMFDCVGSAIDALRFLPEASEDNTSFLVVIISDGEENSSKNYSQHDIARRVTQLQNSGRWTFSYLGANQDLSKVSQQLGIHLGNTMSFSATAHGVGLARSVNSLSTANYMNARSNGVNSVDNFYTSDQSGSGSRSTISTTTTTTIKK